jgi:ABC-type antimicrobial peptide transport system ATPase subunit
MDLSLSMLALSFGALVIQSLRGISYSYLTENLGKMLKRNSFEKAINKHMTEIDEYGAQNYAHIITINC